MVEGAGRPWLRHYIRYVRNEPRQSMKQNDLARVEPLARWIMYKITLVNS